MNNFENISEDINNINYTLEKENLQRIVKIINNETLSTIEKRKSVLAEIVNYREKAIEEFKDDEDKLIEYFDHERYVKEESFNRLDKRLKELTMLYSNPYFGRIDFIEDDDAEKLYIGRFGLTPEGSFQPEIVDWRAPIASLFYAGRLGNLSYEAPDGEISVDVIQKRQFIIKNRQLLGMFDSAVEVKDDILKMVLSKNAGDKLKDIIMTIQAEQDRLIRAPKEKSLIIDGVAGSGKTTVALHRIAYLLYNHRKTFEDSVLILGPNEIFMEYISNVLPDLGETGVKQQTYTEFAMGLLNISDIMSTKEYMEKVIAKDEKFIAGIKFKNSDSYIEILDNKMLGLENNYFKLQDIVYRGKVILSENEIRELFTEYYKNMPLFRRSKKIKRIIFSKLKDARDEEIRKINKEINESKSQMTAEEFAANENSIEFQRKLKVREVIKDLMDVKKSMTWLNEKGCIDIYNEINNYEKITIDDLAPMLYLKMKLEGLKLSQRIKHVVIDEAQDYSPLAFQIIKELTDCMSMTVVGDRNQKITPSDNNSTIFNNDKFDISINEENHRLTKSYRSTMEIMNYANKYLKEDKETVLVRQGKEVVEKTFTNKENLVDNIISNVNKFTDNGYESVAIICKSMEQTEELGKLLKEKIYINVLTDEDIIYKSGVVIVPSYYSKGMEFDAVIIVSEDDENVVDENAEDKLMYVMCTRALHELMVFNYNSEENTPLL